MADIARVFTIALVAEMLGEEEERLHDLCLGMDPEDGCLWILDAGGRETQAFTDYGIECLKQIIADERTSGTTPSRP